MSFGLLSTEECAATLEDDPLVPRSRLALAVPFIGKDVPSKSSEFAHPDITIGLTIMAYRYSGLRADDFSDLVDHLTSEFSHEIGPARDRASSLRYEAWVCAAGGRIRGLDMAKVIAQAATTTPGVTRAPVQASSAASVAAAASPSLGSNPQGGSSSEEEKEDLEVVQLKFLQKSNAEQMGKLRELWNGEPLVLHHYLTKFIFPEHMRTQRSKLSASGQSVGGDMLVGRRVGFSGTPSDLLPREMGRCEYETGDDGKMLSTVLDPLVMSHEELPEGWTVERVLERIATADDKGRRFSALIDTGALITGFSNEQVASELLRRGLTWCDGVVFLDVNDKQQVLVRATGRVVSADQCGVPLEKRFAFYDQIHTTGMDIKHVVNATAVITLGKDMVFRDYVQGAYRMRGIGTGQRVHVFVIPEVRELMARERLAMVPKPSDDDDDHEASDSTSKSVAATAAASAAAAAAADGSGGAGLLRRFESAVVEGDGCLCDPEVLKQVVAWLVVNSMRSEQTQWSMLCIQNVSNIYRKTAMEVMLLACDKLACKHGSMDQPLDAASTDARLQLSPRECLGVFEEEIDFSLEVRGAAMVLQEALVWYLCGLVY